MAEGLAVLKAGTQTGAGTVDMGHSVALIKLRASAAAVVTINGQNVSLAVTAEYQEFPVNADIITVVSGTVDYVAIG